MSGACVEDHAEVLECVGMQESQPSKTLDTRTWATFTHYSLRSLAFLYHIG